MDQKTIDIEKILKGKLGSKAKFVPGFLVNWLKRIAHQDEVNAFLWESRDKKGVEWLEECVRYLDMTLEIEGKENLPSPDDGRLYTFVSNHPLGGEDGVALGAIIGRHYDGRFRYLVNDLLMNLPGLAPVCIPINKTGSQSRNFPAMVEAGFQSENHMLMFPAGLCSRKKKGVVSDIPWTKTFVSKSVEYQRYSWSMKCTRTYTRRSASPSASLSPGRPSTRARAQRSGPNTSEQKSINCKP